MTDAGYAHLSCELGLSVRSLQAMEVGWIASKSAYSFPMRNSAGDIVGIRTRHNDGKKSIAGSDGNGLFFVTSMLTSEYLIVCEGPTDCCALMDVGFSSTIGRPSCRGGTKYTLDVIRRLKPEIVLLMPDNDEAGLLGFTALANSLLRERAIPLSRLNSLLPPGAGNDVRKWLKKDRNDLAGCVAATFETIRRLNEETPDAQG